MNFEETVAVIRSLLSSTKTSYSVCTLNTDFKNETGIDIPLFGYKNVNDFLDSIPDTVKLTGLYPIQKVHLVNDEKSAHIVSLVKRQKDVPRRGKNIKNQQSFNKFNFYYRQRPNMNYYSEESQLENESLEDDLDFIKNDSESAQENIYTKKESQSKNNTVKDDLKLKKCENSFQATQKKPYYSKGFKVHKTFVKNDKEVKLNFQPAQGKSNKMIGPQLENNPVKNETERKNSFKAIKKKSYDIIEPKLNNDFIENDKEVKSNFKSTQEKTYYNKSPQLENRTEKGDITFKRNGFESNRNRSNNTKRSELPNSFTENDKEFKYNLNMTQENGCNEKEPQFENNTVEDDVKCTMHNLNLTQEYINGMDLFKYDQKNLTRKLPSSTSDSSVSVDTENVLGPEDKILPVNLNLYTKIGDYVEVCPTEVYSPNKFYLYLRRYKKKFARLVDRMQVLYENQNEAFRMSDKEIKPERMCAVLHTLHSDRASWCRGEIIKTLNDARVIVSLIDHGVIVNAMKENLCFLHRKFGSLPRQIIHASLANIKPSKGAVVWSRAANERFAELVRDKDLVAGVVDLDAKVPWINVALSFTKDVEVHVNDTLVQENLAVFAAEVVDSKFEQNLAKKLQLTESSSSSSSNPTNSNSALSDESPIYYSPRNEKLKEFLRGYSYSKS